MVDHGTAKYLEENIGGVLSKALGDMVVAQPNDGVDFLAEWLRIHIEQEQARGKQVQEEADLAEARAKAREREAAAEARAAKRKAEAISKEKLYQGMVDKLSGEHVIFEDTYGQELLQVASSEARATSAYLGLVDEEGLDGIEGPLIRYTEVLEGSVGSQLVLEKVLRSGQGVTWGAVTEGVPEEDHERLHIWRPPVPPPVPNPENPDEPPVEAPPRPYMPVSVSCVTDAQEMHYYDVTRLGAYLAVPVIYSTYFDMATYAAVKVHVQERKVTAKKHADAMEAYETAVAEATQSGGEEAAAAVEKPADPDPEKDVEFPVKAVKMVLCLDTLGTNRQIDPSCFKRVLDLCDAFSKRKQESEKSLVYEQAAKDLDETAREEASERIAALRAKADEEVTDNPEEADAEDESKKDLMQKRRAYLASVRVLQELKDDLLTLRSWVVAPPEMLSLIASCAFMYGFKKEDVYPKKKQTLRWDEIRNVLGKALLQGIEAADVCAARKGVPEEQKLASLKALRNGAEFDAEKVTALSPGLSMMADVVDRAVEYRTAHLQWRKACYDRQKEEQGEDFNQPPLEEDDDDFVGL